MSKLTENLKFKNKWTSYLKKISNYKYNSMNFKTWLDLKKVR